MTKINKNKMEIKLYITDDSKIEAIAMETQTSGYRHVADTVDDAVNGLLDIIKNNKNE